MGSSNPQDLGNGGVIDGTLQITGDLQVDGGGSLSFDEVIEGTQQIKVTNTSALLVEKADGTDVLKVDTTNSDVYITGDLDITGSITNAAWTGDVIASAYLDSDTAHLSGTQTFTGNKTFSGTLTVGADGSGQDVIFYSATAGDSFAWDASEEKLTITGTNGQTALDVADGNLVVADNVDIEGDIDVNGTTNLDAVDIDGNVQLDGTFTVGTDGSGQDVTFYSATSGDSFVWDASEEKLTITGTDGAVALDVADGIVKIQESLSITNPSGSFYVWSDDPFGSNYEVIRIDKPSGSNGRISVYKGGTGTYRGLSLETGSAGEGIIIDSSSNVAIANNLDVDGTTNLDAVDIDGAVQIDSTVTVGVDDTGQDVKFFGATSGKYMLWDESGDDLIVSGAIGINGTPSYDLHIAGTRVQIDGDTPVIVLKDTSSYAQNTGAQLVFQGLDSASATRDFGYIQGSSRGDNDGALDFYTRASGTNTLRMRIDEGGATTFNGVVDITDTTDASDDSGDTGALRVEGGASIAKKLYVGGATTVGENDATASSLGIGTDASITANTTKLQIGNHNTAVSAIYLTDNDAQDDWYIASNQTLAMGYNNSAKLSITQAGNVGINTNAPETKFTIDQTADDNGIRIYGYDDVSSRYGEIFIDSSGYLNIDASTDRGIEIKGHANDFWVNSGADLFVRMTYDSKLGVGTTSPSEVLTVSGNIDLKNSSGFAKIDNSGSLSMTDDATVTISSSRNGSALILVYEVGSGIGALFFTCFGLAVTKLAGTSLTANSDSDGDLCCFNSGHTITIKNRLGATKTVVITVLGGNVY